MNRNGFTITELLVVTAILSLVLTAMTIALLQQQRQFNLTREVSDVDQTGRAALDLISSEIRNAASRQGKTFSLDFINGGGANCNANTADSGTIDSPPDCLSIRTWDIARGMERGAALTGTCIKNSANDGKACLPSIVTQPSIMSSIGNLVLRIPDQWVDSSGNLLGESAANVNNVLIGVRSRITLCPTLDVNGLPAAQCNLNPEKCSECSALFTANIDTNLKTATISDLTGVKDHNFPAAFNNLQEFIDGKAAGGINYGFLPSIGTQPSDMTLVTSRTYRVDPVSRELEQRSDDNNVFQPIIGGLDAPGIADLQFVFTLQSDDGETLKVGLPLDAANNIYSDFSQIPAAIAKDVKDIREVEIYLVVKSKIRPQQISGGFYDARIPVIADVLNREVSFVNGTLDTTQQSVFKEPELGFIYRVFTTTVYPRNMGREDFG